jgi:hypothetical protein
MYVDFISKRRAEKERIEKEEQALRNALLKHDAKLRATDNARKAVAYCEYCITSYEDWFNWNEGKWQFWQRVVIVGGVVATLAGVVTVPQSWLPSDTDLSSLAWLRGLPAAIVTVAAAYMSSFTYREDAVRHELTANALWNELAKFQTQAQPYNKADDEDTSLFVNNICRIVDAELRSWSALVSGNRTKQN